MYTPVGDAPQTPPPTSQDVSFSRVKEVGSTPNVFATTSLTNTPSRPQDVVDTKEQQFESDSDQSSPRKPVPQDVKPKGDSLDPVDPFTTYTDDGKVHKNEIAVGTRLNILL
jgi:hypothetical protein